MFKNILKSIAILILTSCVAFSAQGVRFNVIPGDAEANYNKMINGNILKTGFILSDPHERINDAYAKRYGNLEDPNYDENWKVSLDNLGFFSISHDEKLNALLKKAPELGGFSPFNLHIYKNKDDNKTYVGHILPSTMLDIVGVSDPAVRDEFIAMFSSLDEHVQNTLGGEIEISLYDKLPTKPMMTFELEFDKPDDIIEFIEEFQENFEEAFEDKKYIIAGFKDFKETYADLEMSFDEYDAYFVYSLCHFTYSYNMFNKGRPDAGVFAPCSIYAYIKKDSNKIVIGMPKLSNWIAVMNIKDEAMKKSIEELDIEIVSIMKELGAKEI
ncbi:MAG: hypothetical protein L3I99_00405 [Sulfurimonas sp.]|nr:hypothetical protein [Sulfurimonas sp.]